MAPSLPAASSSSSELDDNGDRQPAGRAGRGARADPETRIAQRLLERRVCKTGLPRVDEHLVARGRPHEADAGCLERGTGAVTALLDEGAFCLELRLRSGERSEGRELGDGWAADAHRLLELGHRPEQGLRPRHVPDPPAGEAVRLGEAVDRDGALRHPRHGADAQMDGAVEDEGLERLDREDGQPLRSRKLRHGREPAGVRDASSRGRRRDEDDRAGAPRHAAGERIRVDGETLRRIPGDHACGPTCQPGDVPVEPRCGPVDDDVVAALEQHVQRDEERLTCAAGDEHLALGVDPDAVLPFELLGDRMPQRVEARPRRVVRLAVVERLLRGVAHVRRRCQTEAVCAQIDQPRRGHCRALGMRDRAHAVFLSVGRCPAARRSSPATRPTAVSGSSGYTGRQSRSAAAASVTGSEPSA